MREKIYRAKRKNWKELPKEKWWVEGAVFEGKENSYILTNIKVTDEWEDSEIGADAIGYLVDPETICEPTGLTDKNGKKIFEGDILKEDVEDAEETGTDRFIYSVLYSEEHSAFTTSDVIGEGYFEPLAEYINNNSEVIGNIFDNPELIGDQL